MLNKWILLVHLEKLHRMPCKPCHVARFKTILNCYWKGVVSNVTKNATNCDATIEDIIPLTSWFNISFLYTNVSEFPGFLWIWQFSVTFLDKNVLISIKISLKLSHKQESLTAISSLKWKFPYPKRRSLYSIRAYTITSSMETFSA